MKATPLMLVLALLTVSFAFVPTASAAQCVVGDDPDECAVSVQMIVCVTEPCNSFRVCVNYGAVCRTV